VNLYRLFLGDTHTFVWVLPIHLLNKLRMALDRVYSRLVLRLVCCQVIHCYRSMVIWLVGCLVWPLNALFWPMFWPISTPPNPKSDNFSIRLHIYGRETTSTRQNRYTFIRSYR